MNGERVLTRAELNRALLARQMLLQRVDISIPRALERMAGLQAQYAPAMYIGLWSRLKAFERDQLNRALEERTVVQGTLMRVTIHLVSAGDYWPFAIAVREARRKLWLRGQARRLGQDDESLTAAAEELRQRLGDGPLQRKEVEELVGRSGITAVGLWLDLVRVPPSGTWERRRADLYAAADLWIKPINVPSNEASEHLVHRYLAGFGPATKADIASWSGLAPGEVATVVDRLDLRRFRSEGGEELLDLPDAPLPDRDTPAPVRFLPTWDATLLVHARRTGILPEEYRPLVFNTKTPHSVNTFLVDGSVAGTWRYDDGRVQLEPFGELDESTWEQLRDEAEALAELHA
ncbi:MAG: winged helix DNA-binding domain-containing protein [Actinobacteria bacterium]|nr:winged helix DNA-binding domain-containing protein [Actinomycetota bacterium]